MTSLLLACVTFVGTHFLLSHPLRAPIVAKIGEGPFLGVYSLVALATLGWVGTAFWHAPVTAPLWDGAADAPWGVASAIMLAAAILFAGSLSRNPVAPNPGGAHDLDRPATGPFAITRHPMMWAFALWGVAHILIMPSTKEILLAGSIIILALGGAWGQDRKKERLLGSGWAVWEARTSYLPFVRQLSGAAPWRDTLPSLRVLLIGVILWLLATLAHGSLGAGLWRWIA